MVKLESSSSYALDQQRGTPLNIADTAVNIKSINQPTGGGGVQSKDNSKSEHI